jgi:hypothetical protein
MTTIINGSSPSITFSDGSAQTSATRPFLNRIINGAMVIDQRNAGASVSFSTGANAYTLDRWYFNNQTGGAFTAQQSSTAPVGFSNSLLLTVTTNDSSLAAGEYVYLAQLVEGFNFADCGWGSANAKTVTLSFWVRSSLTGTFGGAFRNSAVNRSYPFTYSISVADTWEQKTITVAGDTSGTWVGATNGLGVQIDFGLGIGSTFSGTAGAWAGSNLLSSTGATSVVGTSGATFYITGVQLEVGSTATSFDYRPYTTELQLAQRYYWKNTSVVAYGNMAIGSCDGSTIGIGYAKYPVTMRAAPTVNYSTIRIADGTVAPAVTSISYNSSTYENMGVAFVASGGGLTLGRAVQIQGNNSTTAFIDASAEL